MFKHLDLARWKQASTLYYAAGVLFALAGLVAFVGRDKSMGVVWIALCAVFVALGAAQGRKELP